MTRDVLKTAALTRPHSFELAPDAVAREALALELGISSIRKLRFAGSITPDGDADLALDATLGATIVPVSYTHLTLPTIYSV